MYTANMTAHMTISHQATDLTTPLELLKQTTYQWGVVDSTNPQILLESNIKQEYRTLGHESMKLNTRYRPNRKILLPDWLITSHVT